MEKSALSQPLPSALLSAVLLSWVCVTVVTGYQCHGEEVWASVDPSNYDMKYSPVTDADARPFGYSVGYFNYNWDSGLCVKVVGTASRFVEVRVEASPATTICVRSVTDDPPVMLCSEADGRISLCQRFASVGNATEFEFYCNDECFEQDVNFWYRFVISSGVASDGDEQWCWGREDDFPTNLVELAFIQTTDKTTGNPNSAPLATCSAILLVTSLAVSRWLPLL